MLSLERKQSIIHNLCIVAGLKQNATAFALLSEVVDVVLEKGLTNVNAFVLGNVSINLNGRVVELPEKAIPKVVAGLTLVNDFAEALNASEVRKASEPVRSRNNTTHRYSKDTDSVEMLRISRLVCEWRIPSDGSRPLSWRNVRAELGGLDEKELRNVICRSPEYLIAVKERISELLNRPEGWECSVKLSNLTRLNVNSVEELLSL